jgi:hypothetical protein
MFILSRRLACGQPDMFSTQGVSGQRHRIFVRRAAVLLAITISAFFSISGMAGIKEPPWISKDWTKWTAHDCQIMLGGSPWTQLTSFPTVSLNSSSVSASFVTQVQLRSALPIRQVLLRQLQLEKRYDKMNGHDKQAFDEAHAHDLVESDQILVYVVNASVEPPPRSGSRRPDQVLGPFPPRQAALRLSDGTLVMPIETNKVNYSSVELNTFLNQYEYVFPRNVKGGPTFTSNELYLQIQFGAPLVLDKRTGKVEQQDFAWSGLGFTFKFSDLMYMGKLEY